MKTDPSSRQVARSSWAPCSPSSCPPAPVRRPHGHRRATDSSGGGGAGDNSGYTIAMVTHETPGDTFWDKIKSGAQQAATNYGIDLKYSNDPDPGKQATLIQNAIDSKVDGIATTLATPDALAGAVKDANDAKIPVVAFNSGIDQYKDVGALMYFGSDENLAGETAGERIAEAGGKTPALRDPGRPARWPSRRVVPV